MAEQTTNYKLIKPALTDIPDITAINPNWDTIDSELKGLHANATISSAGLMSAADKTKLEGIATGATANEGTITGVAAGNGLTGGGTSGSVTLNVGAGTGITVAADTVGVKLKSTTALTNDATAATETSGRVYPVAVDKSGNLAVNVPWTDTASFTIAADASDDDVVILSGTNGSNKVTYSASHATKGPSTTTSTTKGATTDVTINDSSASGSIKVPKVTVDKYGHTTGLTEQTLSITLPTIPTSLKNPNALTVGEKTYDGSSAISITAADLGLSAAMKFLGTSATEITDGATTNPITIGSASVTVSSGNVVLYGSKEFVWNGSAWEELGNEGSYKVVQEAVSSPTASGTATAFIDTISQDANGKITATKKNIATASTSAYGMTKLSSSTSSNSSTLAATASAVKTAYDLANAKMNKENPAGTGSFSMNRKANTTIGNYSHAEGFNTTASGHHSHAEGYVTIAFGSNAHAEGNNTIAFGNHSHAEGNGNKYQLLFTGDANTTTYTVSFINQIDIGNIIYNRNNDIAAKVIAIDIDNSAVTLDKTLDSDNSISSQTLPVYATGAFGNYSHVEGYYTTASGEYSHAEGRCTIASGNFGSHAEGNNTAAFGHSSHAEGNGTKASSSYQHVQGLYNIDDPNGKYAHIVGNGSSNAPSNAHTLDWDGNAWFAGGLKVGGASQDDPNAVEVALKTDIPDVASSAKKLQTARKINGVAFDGTADIVVPSSVKIGIVTLTANGWVEDATLGAFKQTATIPNLANGHKVDLDADLNTINQLPASIVPYNDNGTFYAVTLTPPSVDIAVQYTLLATN